MRKMLALAALGMSLAVAAIPTVSAPSTDNFPRVTAPQEQQQRTPAPVISHREEGERVRDLSVFGPPRRRVWDGKNRTSGDRAHKRMKRRRAAGKAA
jgi:hypothetical protein